MIVKWKFLEDVCRKHACLVPAVESDPLLSTGVTTPPLLVNSRLFMRVYTLCVVSPPVHAGVRSVLIDWCVAVRNAN